MTQVDFIKKAKSIIGFIVSYSIFYVVFTGLFFLIWPYIPGIKISFLLVEVVFILAYLYLFHKYLKKKIGDDKYLRYNYCFRHFLLFWFVSFMTYLVATGMTKPARANLLIITFWLTIVYGILQRKYKKKK